MARLSFRDQVLRVREDAIIASVNRLLAEKGFEGMTVDEVAADVGIAKASLYKHFPSKEALAAAAMVRLLQRALAYLDALEQRPDLLPLERLEAVTRWLLELLLAGEMPTLPSQNSTLRAELMASRPYMDALMQASDRLGGWIVAAQAAGALDPALPSEVVLYTIFARACDPVPAFLKAAGAHDDAQIVEWIVSSCFRGLRARAAD